MNNDCEKRTPVLYVVGVRHDLQFGTYSVPTLGNSAQVCDSALDEFRRRLVSIMRSCEIRAAYEEASVESAQARGIDGTTTMQRALTELPGQSIHHEFVDLTRSERRPYLDHLNASRSKLGLSRSFV